MPKATDSVAERGAFVVVGGPGAILARIRCAPFAVDGLRLRALAACERTVSTTGRMDR